MCSSLSSFKRNKRFSFSILLRTWMGVQSTNGTFGLSSFHLVRIGKNIIAYRASSIISCWISVHSHLNSFRIDTGDVDKGIRLNMEGFTFTTRSIDLAWWEVIAFKRRVCQFLFLPRKVIFCSASSSSRHLLSLSSLWFIFASFAVTTLLNIRFTDHLKPKFEFNNIIIIREAEQQAYCLPNHDSVLHLRMRVIPWCWKLSSSSDMFLIAKEIC